MQDEHGARHLRHIPAGQLPTVFIDQREWVTWMTLGACPERLVLGWLLNQRLITRVTAVQSASVDGDGGAAAVNTHAGIASSPACRLAGLPRSIARGRRAGASVALRKPAKLSRCTFSTPTCIAIPVFLTAP